MQTIEKNNQTSQKQGNQLLKTKYNQLIELYKNKEKELDDLRKLNMKLEEELELLKIELEGCKEQLSEASNISFSNDLHKFFYDFSAVIKNLAQKDAFIPYAYSSKYSKDYCKVEKTEFESCVADFSDIPLKMFRQYCIQLMLTKSEDGNCVFNSNKIQLYYINKYAVAGILGDVEG